MQKSSKHSKNLPQLEAAQEGIINCCVAQLPFDSCCWEETHTEPWQQCHCVTCLKLKWGPNFWLTSRHHKKHQSKGPVASISVCILTEWKYWVDMSWSPKSGLWVSTHHILDKTQCSNSDRVRPSLIDLLLAEMKHWTETSPEFCPTEVELPAKHINFT